MKTNRSVQRLAKPVRILMTTTLVFLAVLVVQVSCVEIARTVLSRRPAPTASTAGQELTAEQQRTVRIWRARKEFLPDGTVHLVTEVGGPRHRSWDTPEAPSVQVQVYDVNDKLLWDGRASENPFDYLAWAQVVNRDSFRATALHRRTQIVTPDVAILEFPVATETELLEKWRYSPWYACFLGYSLEGERLGYLSASGATETKSQARPFGPFGSLLGWWPPEAYSPTVLWQTERRIYQISFDKQKVENIFESPDSDITGLRISRWGSYRPEPSNATAKDRQLLQCLTKDGVRHAILRDPNQTISVTIPNDWNQWSLNDCGFAATEQGLFMRHDWIDYPARLVGANSKWWVEYRRATKTQWVELYRVSETGALDLVNRYSWTVPKENPEVAHVEVRDPRSYVQPFVTAFSPLACDLMWTGWLRFYRNGRPFPNDWTREFFQFINEIRPGYRVGGWLVMAVLLALTFLHGRARHASKTVLVFWLVFVALLSLTGFLVYWALNHTPVIKCPACGKRRGLSEVDCVRCQAPLPAPKRGKLDLVFGV